MAAETAEVEAEAQLRVGRQAPPEHENNLQDNTGGGSCAPMGMRKQRHRGSPAAEGGRMICYEEFVKMMMSK